MSRQSKDNIFLNSENLFGLICLISIGSGYLICPIVLPQFVPYDVSHKLFVYG